MECKVQENSKFSVCLRNKGLRPLVQHLHFSLIKTKFLFPFSYALVNGTTKRCAEYTCPFCLSR